MMYYVGMDLHSDNTYVGIIHEDENRLLKGRFPNDLADILKVSREKLLGLRRLDQEAAADDSLMQFQADADRAELIRVQAHREGAVPAVPDDHFRVLDYALKVFPEKAVLRSCGRDVGMFGGHVAFHGVK